MVNLCRTALVAGLFALLLSPRAMAAGKAEAALDEVTTIEFVDTPLQDVMAYLSNLHSVKVVLSPGVKPAVREQALTYSLKGIKLRSALNLILGRLELGYSADGDRLIVAPIAKKTK